MDPDFRFDPDSSSDEEEVAVGRPPPQSPWEFSAYLGAAVDEPTRENITSVDSKISRALQEHPPVPHPEHDEISEDEDEEEDEEDSSEAEDEEGEEEEEGEDEVEEEEGVESEEEAEEEVAEENEDGDVTSSDDESDKKVVFSV
jgi:hypothetical protein